MQRDHILKSVITMVGRTANTFSSFITSCVVNVVCFFSRSNKQRLVNFGVSVIPLLVSFTLLTTFCQSVSTKTEKERGPNFFETVN